MHFVFQQNDDCHKLVQDHSDLVMLSTSQQGSSVNWVILLQLWVNTGTCGLSVWLHLFAKYLFDFVYQFHAR